MKNVMKFLTITLIAVFAVSCSKNNETGISLSFKGKTTSPLVKKSTIIAGFTFTEALLGIKEIEIKKENEIMNDNDMEFDFKENYIVDLLTGTTTPALGFTEFLPGAYDKFESKTSIILNGGKSLSVNGIYTHTGSTVYKFEFSTTSELKFEFESDSSFILSEGSVLNMLINVNLPMLFEGVDFSKAIANESGIIVINELSNSAITEAIKFNIKHVGEMKDENESESH